MNRSRKLVATLAALLVAALATGCTLPRPYERMVDRHPELRYGTR